ncbi:unnamed protein product, partial [Caretta caretta]
MDLWLKEGTSKGKASSSGTPTVAEINEQNIVTLQSENEQLQSFVAEKSVSTSALSKVKEFPLKYIKKQEEAGVKRPKRKYDESYLSFSFTCVGNKDVPDAQCIMCNKILENSSLAPAKLHRHLETKHAEYKDKDISFFKRQR